MPLLAKCSSHYKLFGSDCATSFLAEIRSGPENWTSDRMIKTSEIYEPNFPTLLDPSNQKSKLTSGGRLAAHSIPTPHRRLTSAIFGYFPVCRADWREMGRKMSDFFPETLMGTRSRVDVRDALAKCTQHGVAISQFGFPFIPCMA